MRARVSKERKHSDVLQERPGPPVGKQQRQRPRTATFHVHHVQCMPRDLSTQLAQVVEAELKSIGIKGSPVLQQGVQPLARHASLPARPEVWGLSIIPQPAAELAQPIGRQPATLLNNRHATGIAHLSHPDTPAHPASQTALADRAETRRLHIAGLNPNPSGPAKVLAESSRLSATASSPHTWWGLPNWGCKKAGWRTVDASQSRSSSRPPRCASHTTKSHAKPTAAGWPSTSSRSHADSSPSRAPSAVRLCASYAGDYLQHRLRSGGRIRTRTRGAAGASARFDPRCRGATSRGGLAWRVPHEEAEMGGSIVVGSLRLPTGSGRA